ncbi:MAG: 23S rRNA (uracil1939-C5)-methyltransferase [Myxococcota bacterium]|jgi:23S rRNA (uracil1939-C5)-methyltransferase
MTIRTPPCPIHVQCGGCSEMHRPEADQLASRSDWIARLLGRPPDQVVPSPRPLGYRARVTLRPDKTGRLGYFRPRTHTHVPVTDCAIARPEINAVLAALPPLPAGVASAELRSDGEQVILAARRAKKHRGQVDRGALKALMSAGLKGVALDGGKVAGDPTTTLTVHGITHRLQSETFYQVNLEINAALVALVADRVAALSPTRLLDLYAGAGNLSLPLAAAGTPVTLIESSRSSTADAAATIARHDLSDRTEIRTGNADRFKAGDAFFDVVLLDPPRAGAQRVIPQLLITRPAAILYISCNPTALARDLRPAFAAGYQLDEVVVFEMFPQTPHVEVFVRLSRP